MHWFTLQSNGELRNGRLTHTLTQSPLLLHLLAQLKVSLPVLQCMIATRSHIELDRVLLESGSHCWKHTLLTSFARLLWLQIPLYIATHSSLSDTLHNCWTQVLILRGHLMAQRLVMAKSSTPLCSRHSSLQFSRPPSIRSVNEGQSQFPVAAVAR